MSSSSVKLGGLPFLRLSSATSSLTFVGEEGGVVVFALDLVFEGVFFIAFPFAGDEGGLVGFAFDLAVDAEFL